MTGEDVVPEFDFTAFTELLDDRTSNITMGVVLALVVVVLAYTTVDLANLNKEVRGLVEGENYWDVSFELQSMTYQETIVMVDGEQRQLDFDVDQSDLPEGFRVGQIRTPFPTVKPLAFLLTLLTLWPQMFSKRTCKHSGMTTITPFQGLPTMQPTLNCFCAPIQDSRVSPSTPPASMSIKCFNPGWLRGSARAPFRSLWN